MKQKLWDLRDLAGPSDIAYELGVNKSTVSNWLRRYPNCPKPLWRIGGRDVYSRSQIMRWLRQSGFDV